MQRKQANRARIAERVTTQPRLSGRPAVDLTARHSGIVPPCGAGIRVSRVKYAGSATGGYGSAWAGSQSYRTMVTTDARWDRTVSR